MKDHEIAEAIAQARALLESIDGELAHRRDTDPVQGFTVWSSARLDALGMVHGVKRLEQTFTAALRRRRRARRAKRVAIAGERRAS
jgi:hypothetical protein